MRRAEARRKISEADVRKLSGKTSILTERYWIGRAEARPYGPVVWRSQRVDRTAHASCERGSILDGVHVFVGVR